ncbi:hypothetical protein ACP4OV_003100 [Aristida adscensionis]
MVLEFSSCFGVSERKLLESSKRQEAGVVKKPKEVAEEASSKAGEKKEEKVREEGTGYRGKSSGAPLVVPHFPQRSAPGLL